MYGCDSVIIQNLVIDSIYYQILDNQFICPGDSVLLFGTYYTTAGTYIDSLTTLSGCDSVLQVTLLPASIPPVGILNYSLSTLCNEGGTVMVPLASPAGGVYSGPGVSGTLFDPDGLTPGTYYTTYTYTDNYGCSNSDSTDVDVVDCLGIGELGDDQEIVLYPNPNNGMFTLRFGYVEEPMNISVYNSLGMLVYQIPVHQTVEVVELPSPKSGVYLLIIATDHGVAYRRMVVE